MDPHAEPGQAIKRFVEEAAEEKEEAEYADVHDDIQSGDFKFRVALVGVAALTIVSAVAFYLHKKPIQPENGRVSAFDAVFMDDSLDNDSRGASPVDVLNAGSDGTSTTAYDANQHPVLYSDTFAAPQAAASGQSGNSAASATTDVNMGRPTDKPRVQTLSETYTSSALGISMLKDPYWKASWSNTQNGPILYFKNVGPRSLDTIVFARFKGASVTTSDAKNGSVTYFYDATSSAWMMYRGGLTAYSPDEASAATPSIFTSAGKPVFDGVSSAKTLVVALGTRDFLIVNINSAEYPDLFEALVKSIRGL